MEMKSSKKSYNVSEPECESPEPPGKMHFFCGIPMPEKYSKMLKHRSKILATVAFHVWFVWAVAYHVTLGLPIQWCDGLGFIVILMFLTYFTKILKYGYNRAIPDKYKTAFWENFDSIKTKMLKRKWVRLIIYAVLIAFMVIYIAVDSKGDKERLLSAGGLLILILFGVLLSNNRRKIPWRIVFGGVFVQFIFALLILKWQFGQDFMGCLGNKVSRFMRYTVHGSSNIYDYLADRQPFLPELLPNNSNAYIFAQTINEAKAVKVANAFGALPVVSFFTVFTNILFFYGIVQWVTKITGDLFAEAVGTSEPESANAAANIFLGQALAPLVVKHYLPTITRSEAHSMLASGFASIAGVTMAVYISYGVDPTSLLAASVMSAPAALAYAKILYPETENTKGKVYVRKTNINTNKCHNFDTNAYLGKTRH